MSGRSGKLLRVSEWLALLLMSLGAWCAFSLVLGLVIGPLLRKQDLLSELLTALGAERRGVSGA